LCHKRIENRNRKGEESIPISYLENCHNYHKNWINNANIPVLYIDGHPEHSTKLATEIKEFVENDKKK
jgi:deoxyadenosine/deoxycytidine kinase